MSNQNTRRPSTLTDAERGAVMVYGRTFGNAVAWRGLKGAESAAVEAAQQVLREEAEGHASNGHRGAQMLFKAANALDIPVRLMKPHTETKGARPESISAACWRILKALRASPELKGKDLIFINEIGGSGMLPGNTVLAMMKPQAEPEVEVEEENHEEEPCANAA